MTTDQRHPHYPMGPQPGDKPTIETLALYALDQLETATRPNGDTFLRFKESAAEWTQDLAFAAHDNGDIMPDDHRYQYMHDALEAIADGDTDPMLEPDIYTHDLTAWLHSSNNRLTYVEDAIQNMGASDSFEITLMHAQQTERQEVYYQVLSFLEDKESEG